MTENVMAPLMPEEKVHHPGLGFKGLWQVIFAPTELFRRIKEDPKILVPYVAYFFVVVGFFWFTWEYNLEAGREALERRLEAQGMTMADLPPSALTGMKAIGVALQSILMALLPIVIAGLAMVWGGFVFAGRASFRAILSVSLFGEFLYALGEWVRLPLILAKDSMLVTFSAAAFLPDPDLTSLTYQLLSKVSIFHIWELIVLGIGFSIIFGISRNKGFGVAVLSMGLLSILHALSTGIGAMFA